MKNSDATQPAYPLCVDLDGTLINTDVFLESLLTLLKRNPLFLFCLPFWLLNGVAALKTKIAKRVSVHPATLPYNQPFLDWLKQEKSADRSLWLCTGTPLALAVPVAKHLGFFDGVLATTPEENFTGENKARGLSARFGEHRFDYCGNEAKDIPVWTASRNAIVVNASKSLEAAAREVTEVSAIFPPKNSNKALLVLKAIRLPQWAKNILIFVPLITAHRLTDIQGLKAAALAFFAFSLCASSVYLLNDMLDLDADRQHPRKALRPFAAGDLSLTTGLFLTPLLLISAFLIAAYLPAGFISVLAGYYLLTLAYSFILKSVPIVDILCLACLYTIRIIAGGGASDVLLSFWLLLFSIFMFLSLALVKRCTELDVIQRHGQDSAPGRGYQVADLPLLKGFGIAAGYLGILVLALYIDSPAVSSLYRHPQVIWLLCLLVLYWIMRLWFKTHRGKMHDDPIIFALKDPTSLILGLLAALTMLAAI